MRTFFLLSLLTLSTATANLAADLKDALTFRATFDGTTDASIALGDKRLFVAPSYKEQATATPGLSGGDVVLEPGGGRHGGALHFLRKNTRAIFYRADKNVSFDPHGWTGSVSLWLNLDPEKDLEPGFCDLIQITMKPTMIPPFLGGFHARRQAAPFPSGRVWLDDVLNGNRVVPRVSRA